MSKGTASTNNRWKNDKLDRQLASESLTRYLKKKYESEESLKNNESYVLNINAHWGFGKTYFLSNWSEDLKNQGYPVIFFNAWESDYYDDPMTAFICEIKSQLEKYVENEPITKALLKTTMSNGFKLLKTGLPIITSILTKKLTGYTFEQIINLYQETNKEKNDASNDKTEIENAVSQIFVKSIEDTIASYEQSKKDIKDFKEQLTNLITQLKSGSNTETPLFIFIDELDRCRPTYAIELLEKIKHIFNVSGVYFIVATASNQLCHSIKSIYGLGFDAETYLKRFFDQIYEFEEPELYKFTEFLFEKFNILNHKNNFFSPIDSATIGGGDVNIETFVSLSKYFKLGLRDQEQVAKNLYAICLFWHGPSKIHLFLMLYLLMLKHRSDEMFSVLIVRHANILNSKIVPAYPQFIDNVVSLKTYTGDKYHVRTGSPPETIRVSEVINFYLTYLKENQNDFMDRIETNYTDRMILRAIDSQKKKDIETPPITNPDEQLDFTKYFGYVKQIGQLKEI